MFSETFRLFGSTVLLTASLAQAGVVPRHAQNDPGTYSITQIPNPHFIRGSNSGSAALNYSYNKHKIESPAVLLSTPAGQIGSAPVNPYRGYDREYLVPVNIGTNPQTLPLDLDTGSSDLWVFSTDTAPLQVRGQILYQPHNSSTSHLMLGETWSISYGDGSSSSGIVYSDVVAVGGLSFPTQGVESAKIVSSAFSSVPGSSGLIGLAFGPLNTVRPYKQKTFLENIRSQLAMPLFTANLKKGAPGTYNFGYIDSTQYTGSIAYAPVSTSRGLWEFTASGYGIGTASFVMTNIDAIADTGTSLLLLPQSIVTAYWSKVPGALYDLSQGAYTFPCAATLPSFTFGIGTYRGVVPGNYMNYGQVSATTCYGGLQSKGIVPFAVFGDVLLKAQFVVFDLGNTKVGFANKPTL